MADTTPSVSEVLQDAGAVLIRAGQAGRGLSVAEWQNRDSQTCYERPNHHTLSLYLGGGQGVVRQEGQLSNGGPDKVCVLPAGHESRWRIAGPVHLFHLYVAPETLAYQAAARFGIDLGRTSLMDLTFVDDPSVAMIVRGGALPLDWADPVDAMALSSACQMLIHRLLGHRRQGATDAAKGGLSPRVKRRTAEYVHAHLAETLTLDGMADQAGLSTFHFAKMFRLSFGMPPHRYVTECRIQHAKAQLTHGQADMATVAAQCGFSSQSHFGRTFKQITGMTPAVWRLRG